MIGLRIGAANRKLTTSAGFRPRASKLRATGTLPHSQTGSASPAIDKTSRRNNAFFGKILTSFSGGKKQRIRAEMIVPKIRNGTASTMTLSVSVRKSCSDNAAWDNHLPASPLASHTLKWRLKL